MLTNAKILAQAQSDSTIISLCAGINIKQYIKQTRNGSLSAFKKLVECNSKAVPYLIKDLNNRDETVRFITMSVLSEIGVNAAPASRYLTASLNNPSKDLRFLTVHTLGKIGIGAKETVPALITALEDDNYDNYRIFGYMAISAIARIRGNLKYASANLIEALKLHVKYGGGQYAFSDSLIVSSLVQIGKDAVPVVITALQDKNDIVRYEAAGVLGQIGTAAKEALPELTNVFLNRKNVNYVRYKALQAINTISPDKNILSVVNIYKENFMLSPYYASGSRVGKVRKVTRNYLAAKPLVVCKVSIIRTLLPWKCPDEKLTENIEPQVDKKTDNPQPQKRL
ncbi:hypothetical protein F7734_27810 [Scytonema sp. UIC 10036]|uniref:HEAT repeat domain-containing protein n=1 Tax=Scytonema sp. UIC 10036 TaxID=2304196 RepID=UPI0012DAD839|nr:HEAT repeat domain-containing protein [Scytonema sp. UIC 10036]MUG95950.1 hypothetical protein [Scytonema sp. UIC 10036]